MEPGWGWGWRRGGGDVLQRVPAAVFLTDLGHLRLPFLPPHFILSEVSICCFLQELQGASAEMCTLPPRREASGTRAVFLEEGIAKLSAEG